MMIDTKLLMGNEVTIVTRVKKTTATETHAEPEQDASSCCAKNEGGRFLAYMTRPGRRSSIAKKKSRHVYRGGSQENCLEETVCGGK
jgi:hypothetical protein